MRKPPTFQKLDVRFGEPTFPASATIAFEDNSGQKTQSAQQITVLAGKRGTWILELTPHERLPKGSKVAFRKLERDFRFAYRHQHHWPDAMNYVTVVDQRGQALPFECDTCLKSAVWAVVTLRRDWDPGKKIVIRMGDQREGGAGSYAQPNSYERARVAAGVMLEGDQVYRAAPGAMVSIKVVPCPPVKQYYVLAPSTVLPGQTFTTVVLPVDINGNAMDASRDIEIVPSGGTLEAIRETDLQTLHADVALKEQGVVRLKLQDRARGITAQSNPVRVSSGADYHVYWGELHWHGFDAVELNVLNDNTHPDKPSSTAETSPGSTFAPWARISFDTAPRQCTNGGNCIEKQPRNTTRKAAR